MATASKHILVIDDDVTSLDIVSFFFEERGYNVDRCADGKSAIEYVKKITPDLLIVDLMMPEINGVETVKQVRQLGLTDTPIIAFTAVDDSDLHREALEAGCNEVLTKPCPTEKLLRHIKRYLAPQPN
jgi:two-component system alkaline phosphatase synthesis response regulator PhoP